MTLLATKKAPVTLLVIDHPPVPTTTFTQPRSTIPTVSNALLTDPSTRIIDESLSGHLAVLTHQIPIALSFSIIYPYSSFVFSIATIPDHTSIISHVLSHRPAPGKDDEDVGEVLGREWYRLACLGRAKFGFTAALPVHLESVRVVLECFDSLFS